MKIIIKNHRPPWLHPNGLFFSWTWENMEEYREYQHTTFRLIWYICSICLVYQMVVLIQSFSIEIILLVLLYPKPNPNVFQKPMGHSSVLSVSNQYDEHCLDSFYYLHRALDTLEFGWMEPIPHIALCSMMSKIIVHSNMLHKEWFTKRYGFVIIFLHRDDTIEINELRRSFSALQ